MKKSIFKVIKGGGGKTSGPKYKFKRGYVTNTRLMGVVGMKLFWENEEGNEYIQFFHLDFEEYGIDGYESLINGSQEEIDFISAKMMGGLGGRFVRISKKEGVYLLNESYRININNNEALPQGMEEYDFLLNVKINADEEFEMKIWKKISEDITNDIELINYFVMRAVGMDKWGQKHLCINDEAKEFKPTDKAYTLIKNMIEPLYTEEDIKYYNVESLVDLDKGYQLIISKIGVKQTEDGPRVAYAMVDNRMKISSIEATFQLKKPEYILVYSIDDLIEVAEILDRDKPNAMQNIHETGFLYTEFNSNNNHVKNPVYYLNGDIFAVYFITTQNQLAVSTFTEENLEAIKKYFSGKDFKGMMELEGEFKTDTPILYEFVHSGYEDFFDFLNDEE
ncbi:hypothetical protein R9X47_19160 [Wukongibacter baidiensis]|uniref:hypothetical protein n=1 Tax=Wukongibacter baidiensis TaxID=1723361 RepID=UPI003D7F1C7B